MIITCSPLEQFSIIPSIPKRIHKFGTSRKESILYTTPDYPFQLLWFLRYHTNTRLEISIDIRGVDYPSQEGRFKVVYNLPSIRYNLCIRVQIGIDEITSASSVISIFPSAGRWEREMWDMFGLYFSNYPDLRRILTDYGFEGHSLCKDFPSSGYIEVRYDDLEKRVVSEPIEMAQEFRYFDSASPWRLMPPRSFCTSPREGSPSEGTKKGEGEGSRGEDPTQFSLIAHIDTRIDGIFRDYIEKPEERELLLRSLAALLEVQKVLKDPFELKGQLDVDELIEKQIEEMIYKQLESERD